MTLYTRAQYMQDGTQPDLSPESKAKAMLVHRRYYGQFVTAETISRVLDVVGEARLRASTDPHMNDIPLHLWEWATAWGLPGSDRFKEAGDYYTLSGGVCLAKEAARQWLEQQERA
jgi:hypothetical protein